jgi:hypothetical protein
MRYDATRQCEPLSCGFFISARFGQANRDVVSVEMYYEYEDAQFSVSPLAFAHAVLSPGFSVERKNEWCCERNLFIRHRLRVFCRIAQSSPPLLHAKKHRIICIFLAIPAQGYRLVF